MVRRKVIPQTFGKFLKGVVFSFHDRFRERLTSMTSGAQASPCVGAVACVAAAAAECAAAGRFPRAAAVACALDGVGPYAWCPESVGEIRARMAANHEACF